MSFPDRILAPARALVIGLSALTSIASAQAQDLAPAYTAEALHRLADGTTTRGRVFKDGGNMRLEFDQQGHKVVQIIRSAEGTMAVLDPATRSYFEVRGAPDPGAAKPGYSPPCADGDEAMTCTLKGTEVASGITAEKWEITQPGRPGVTKILWDGVRRHALRQEFPDGTLMTLTFKAMETVSGRTAEHWVSALVRPGSDPQQGDWYYDPELRVEIGEVRPGGESRALESIVVGPIDPALFLVPDGWTKVAPPQARVPAGGN